MDYGKYSCRAQNKMGQTIDEIHLDVTSPPDAPSDLEIYNVTHDTVTLTWKRGFDGGLPTSYQIRWRQALDYENRYYYMDINPDNYTARITGLNLGTYYVFSIKAINDKGESPFLPDLVKVQTLRKFTIPLPNHLSYSRLRNNNQHFTCQCRVKLVDMFVSVSVHCRPISSFISRSFVSISRVTNFSRLPYGFNVFGWKKFCFFLFIGKRVEKRIE